MFGSKRNRAEADDQNTVDDVRETLPKNHNFNFIPTIKPDQKLFDVNIETKSDTRLLSSNILTQRFQQRSKQFVEENQKTSKILTLKASSMSSNNGKKPTAIYESRFLKHQDITYTIVLYIQTLFNIICSFCIFYIFVNIILSIKQDFKLKTEEHIHALHEERMSCTNSFIANRCADSDRVPAIENLCNQWASCMNRDTAVAQAKISAEVIAEILNSFVEPISFKTMAFFLIITIGAIAFSNMAFNVFKKSHKPAAVQAALEH